MPACAAVLCQSPVFLPGWCGQILLPSRCHKDQGPTAVPGDQAPDLLFPSSGGVADCGAQIRSIVRTTMPRRAGLARSCRCRGYLAQPQPGPDGTWAARARCGCHEAEELLAQLSGKGKLRLD